MNLGEPIFIFILAFILLGPKRTSELARQVGKLMAEFRKASNDFKFQFNEEMRVTEQQEQQKKQEAERAALGELPALVLEPENSILPPPMGEETVPSGQAAEEDEYDENYGENENEPQPVPYAISAVSATTGEEQPVEGHPLLRVDVIPPMEASNGSAAEETGLPGESATEKRGEAKHEEDGAAIHHG